MQPLYKAPFRKFVKKQPRAFQLIIEDEVEKISTTPALGTTKKGDLAPFQVHKFLHKGQEYLMAYRWEDNILIFYMIGSHENFYRDLKRYVKEVR
jgi:hypothetical protein